MPNEIQSVYDIIGSEEPFRKLVEVFYSKIEHDTVLRPMFPADLEDGKYWQFLFLMQYFGGPTRYMEERGHPRLRMRHFPFTINQTARDHWLEHMLASIDEVAIPEPAASMMKEYFSRASTFLINQFPSNDVME